MMGFLLTKSSDLLPLPVRRQRIPETYLTFHDLRHTCINNWRLQGHDFFRIMAASGHRTMEVFKRYNTVSEEELMKLVEAPMDTYMDTKQKKELTGTG